MTHIKLTEEESLVLSHCPSIRDEEGYLWRYLVPFYYREDKYGNLTCWDVTEIPKLEFPTQNLETQ